MIEERTGEAYELGEQLTVMGRKLEVGKPVPDFALDHFDGETISTVRLSDSTGSVRLLNVVNSLDTPVCDVETRRWDELRSDLPDGVVLYTISMDLPFAQARWGSSANLRHQALSAHRSEDFGREWGVLIKQWRMLQRAVFVVDPDGLLTYAEYVADQMQEPDYTLAVEAAAAAGA
jgi:thioredoxin-dependent peroxiredoxin